MKRTFGVVLAAFAVAGVAGCSSSQSVSDAASAAASAADQATAAASAIQSAAASATAALPDSSDVSDIAANAGLDAYWNQASKSVKKQLCSAFGADPQGSWSAFLQGQGVNVTINQQQFDAFFQDKCGS